MVKCVCLESVIFLPIVCEHWRLFLAVGFTSFNYLSSKDELTNPAVMRFRALRCGACQVVNTQDASVHPQNRESNEHTCVWGVLTLTLPCRPLFLPSLRPAPSAPSPSRGWCVLCPRSALLALPGFSAACGESPQVPSSPALLLLQALCLGASVTVKLQGKARVHPPWFQQTHVIFIL